MPFFVTTGYGCEGGDKILRMTHGPALSSPLGLVLLLALDLPLLVLEVKDGSSLHTEIKKERGRKVDGDKDIEGGCVDINR